MNYYAVQYTEQNPYNLTPEHIRAWGSAWILRFSSKKTRDEWVAGPIPYRDSCDYQFAKVATNNFDPDRIVDGDRADPEKGLPACGLH